MILLKAAFVGITLVVDSYLVTLWGEPLDPMLPAYAVIGLGGLAFLVVYLRAVLPTVWSQASASVGQRETAPAFAPVPR